MKEIDRDGLLLCELQGKIFEKSLDQISTSSEMFIRRFMNSKTVTMLDNGSFLDTNISPQEVVRLVEEEYDNLNYGRIHYSLEEMYWIGYIYRYFSYTYEISSLRAYKIIKPKELRSLYLAYHSLSPSKTIERILEAKKRPLNESDIFQRQYEIFKKIRNKK